MRLATLFALALAAPLQAEDVLLEVHDLSLARTMDTLGDVNGDGFLDVVVGMPGYDAWAGRLVVLSGADGTQLYTVDGAAGDELGRIVAGTGDVDADGAPDIATGHPTLREVRIFSGQDGAYLRTLHADRPNFGKALDFAGDLDGDGHAETVVAMDRRVMVFSGSDGAMQLEIWGGLSVSMSYAASVAGIRDVTGDGVGDLLVGDPADPDGGVVFVLSGADGSEWLSVSGGGTGSLGSCVAPTGDIDGDGGPDFVAGSLHSDRGVGYVRAFSGATGAVLWTSYGTVSSEEFGDTVCGIGDLDGDGLGDVAAGYPSDYSPGFRVLRGTDGLGLADIALDDCNTSSVPVAPLGDWNGDGRADLAVGDMDVGCPGSVFLYSLHVDCDGNGLHDASDIGDGTALDCQGNGVPDDCDLVLGPDCNGNGVPDECDLPDCDANGVPDDCDLASGRATDCDVNGVLDECEVPHTPWRRTSPVFSPVDYTVLIEGLRHTFTLVSPPPAAGAVTLSFEGLGDLNTLPESVEVQLNGEPWWELTESGPGCVELDEERTISRDSFNALIAGGELVIDLVPSEFVDPCPGSFIQVTVDYVHEATVDCDDNGVPDDCDIAGGASEDANGDGIPDECQFTRYCTPVANSTGAPATLGLTGVPSVTVNELELSCAPIQPGTQGLFIYSPDAAEMPLGNGVLCLGSSTQGFINRLPAETSDGAGTLRHVLDVLAPPEPSSLITPGSTWNFQCWFRDLPGGGSFFNLSDALSITFLP